MVSDEVLASAIFGAGLIAATLVLAWFTWTLAKATRQLAAIEADRETAEKRRRRIALLDQRISVAVKLLAVRSSEVLPPSLGKGNLPRPEADYVGELVTTLDEEVPASVTSDVEHLLHAFDQIVDPKRPSLELTVDLILAAYLRVQEWAGKNLYDWRAEVLGLRTEEGAA